MKLFKSVILLSLCISLNAKVLKSDVGFTAVGKPAFIKAKGSLAMTSGSLSIKENVLNGSFMVDLTKLDTGIELRDQHLKEKYLETSKFSFAKIVFVNTPVKVDGEKQKLKGMLSFHGVTKEVSIMATLKKQKDVLKVGAQFDLILTDFNVTLPSFQGITAAKKVDIKVDADVKL